MYFSKHHRTLLKQENTDLSFGDLGKTVGAMWKAASQEERRPFEEMAAADKDRHSKQLAQYKKQTPVVVAEASVEGGEEDEEEELEDDEEVEDEEGMGAGSKKFKSEEGDDDGDEDEDEDDEDDNVGGEQDVMDGALLDVSGVGFMGILDEEGGGQTVDGT